MHYLIFMITEIIAFYMYFDLKHEHYTEYLNRLLLSQYIKFLIYCQLVVPAFKFRVSFAMACFFFGVGHFTAHYILSQPPGY